MTLRKKTLSIIAVTLIVLVGVAYLAISIIVRGSFTELEEDDVSRHVQRVEEAIQKELRDLESKVNDWAKPGQDLDVGTLAGLLDNEKSRPSDQRGNKLADLLDNLDINVFLWTDSSDKIFWGWAYNEVTQGLDLLPSGLRAELSSEPRSRLLSHSDGGTSLNGLLLLPEVGPMLIVSAPIIYHIGDGPVEQASMMMGKFLDEPEVQRLEDLTRLSLDISVIDGDLSEEFTAARSSLLEADSIYVQPVDDPTGGAERVAGYTEFEDINNVPVLMLRADVPRDIMDEGNKSLSFLLIAMIGLGVILVGLIAYLLDKLVLSRMAGLNTQVSAIDTGADLETRVSVPGSDELSNLAGAINGMLGDIQTERGRAENLLLNVLPAPIADRLKAGSTVIVDSFPQVSVLFSDTVGFTKLSASISAEELVDLLNRTFSAFDALADKHGLEKIKTIGDAYMVVGGVPLPVENHAERIAEMALDMHSEIARLNSENKIQINIRVGIHAGPVVAGVIGVRKFSYDLWGDAVNTAARMESHGVPGLSQITEEMYNIISPTGKFDIEDRGIIEVKGKGDMHTYILKGRKVRAGIVSAED